jgi:two-component system, cell cycle sensor histidine kinase and response regulator CckA
MAALACNRARGITQQLLTFAKGGAPIKEVLAVPDLLREAGDFALRGAKVKAEYILAADLWRVEADPGQINQVLNNLIINACQAMPEGGILRIAARNETINGENPFELRPGGFVRIEVADQGIGIPEKHLNQIFDPYFTTKESGSGLGLSISHSIIKKHGGAITVDSKPGEGSTFCLFLPATQKSELAVPPAAEWERSPGAGRILVMDDEEGIHVIAAEMLKFLGYGVEVVRDGTEAVATYRQALAAGKPFAAVITDLTVPAGMGGQTAALHLLALDPKARISVSSGYVNDPVMVDHVAYGFKACMPKPYNLDELGRVLQEVISRPEDHFPAA